MRAARTSCRIERCAARFVRDRATAPGGGAARVRRYSGAMHRPDATDRARAPRPAGTARHPGVVALACLLAAATSSAGAAEFANRLSGDVGAAVYDTRGVVRGQGNDALVLPYAYADSGRTYVRVDTLGVKTWAVGWGHLEAAARVSLEGYDPSDPALAGVGRRSSPAPVGIGTFQATPWGGVFLYGFRDLTSGGSLLEATYAAKLPLGPATLYPSVGVERRSARYVDHLYGVSTAESAASGLPAYAPGASTWPVATLTAQLPVLQDWAVVVQGRRKWLDRATSDSPLVARHVQDSGFIALAYHFR
jgi:outer membrane protein